MNSDNNALDTSIGPILGPDARARITNAYSAVTADIAQCTNESGRNAEAVTLLAVSKTRSAREVAVAYDAGARHFGENYLQDALPKIRWFNDQQAQSSNGYPNLCWHFIGAMQSNKTKEVAAHFSWVHTVDREKIARRLATARPENLSPLNICVQVNLHKEPQKAGVHPDALPELLALLQTLPSLAVRGLMILPAAQVEPKQAFDELAALFDTLTPTGTEQNSLWDTRSMGMSGDYRAAIAAGSTMVRIGTALFGSRPTAD